ncbi:MAG: DsbC family protein [Pseudomonadales bacterium]
MYSKLSRTILCLLGLIATMPVFSQSVEETIETHILDGLRNARPDLDFGEPEPSPVEGYYEVSISGAQTIYVSEDGKHFFSGELYFSEPGRFVNATEMERTQHRLEMMSTLNEEDMIIFKPEGETKAVMTIFTDVTCGFCRKLHDQMAEMNKLGIEVHYLAYPRSGIERDGSYTREYEETVKAWCAPPSERAEVLTALKSGQAVDENICEDSPVEEQYELGRSFGVTGTPAIILPNGSLLPGYRSPEEYARILGINTGS